MRSPISDDIEPVNLGPFEEELQEMRLGLQHAENRPTAFLQCLREARGLVQRGLAKQDAVDQLHLMATDYGVVDELGQDVATRIIGNAVAQKPHGFDDDGVAEIIRRMEMSHPVDRLKHIKPDSSGSKACHINGKGAGARIYAKDQLEDDFATREARAKPRLIQSSKEFTADFVPPDYLWEGVLLRGFVYSFTAQTGDGKTAVTLAFSAAVGGPRNEFAGHEVTKGRVLYFAGENSDDVRMRWIGMAEHLQFDIDTIDVHFITETFDITKLEQKIRSEVDALGGVILVVIDTGPAYFYGESENDNVDMINHAQMLRRLKDLPGKPTIIAATHPIKNATRDNLVPRGGGGFLNAMDGNLCAWRDDMVVTVHHQGKFRGITFEPMLFDLASVTARELVNEKGNPIPTVIARDLSSEAQVERISALRDDEDGILLLLLGRDTPTSLNNIADAMHWHLRNGKPNKSRVQRLIKTLASSKLVETDRDGAILTRKGKEAATRADYNRKVAGSITGC